MKGTPSRASAPQKSRKQSHQSVIVTGGAQGIGRAYALGFAHDGWRVLVADINLAGAESVCSEIAARGGVAAAFACDVSQQTDCRAMVDAAVARFTRVDALINNAAITTFEQKTFTELTVEEWDRMFAVGVRGSWLAMSAVTPVMRRQGGGAIVNVASNTILSARGFMTHYVSAKGAIIGLTRSTARELGEHNIRVNCILPGATLTEGSRDALPPSRLRALLGGQAIKRLEEPDDLVGAALFLASDASRFMTGQSIVVDGGFTYH